MSTITRDTSRLAACELGFLTAFARELASGEAAGDGLLDLIGHGPLVREQARLAAFISQQRREERRHGRLGRSLLDACGGEGGGTALTTALGNAARFAGGEAGVATVHLVLENLIAGELVAARAAFDDCPRVVALLGSIYDDEAKHARFGRSWSLRHARDLASWDQPMAAWAGELLLRLDQQDGWSDLPAERQERYLDARVATWSRCADDVGAALVANRLHSTAATLEGWAR